MDRMIRKGREYNNIYNYKNSKYFIETVKEARRYEREQTKDLVIFAGACESYFEALIMAGANFASSPARILIDFLDPIVIAEKIGNTNKDLFGRRLMVKFLMIVLLFLQTKIEQTFHLII